MKKDTTYIYGIIAYIAFGLGIVLSALWAASVPAAVLSLVCALIGLAAVVKGKSLMQNRNGRDHFA